MENINSEAGPGELFCLGLSHKTTELEIREKIYVRPAALAETLQRFKRDTGIAHAVILSTCNRFELYAHERSDACLAWILSLAPGLEEEIQARRVVRPMEAAVEHLFSVAAGLDAQVLGETQILGQVRDAYEASRQAGMTSSALNTLFQRALSVGKRVRTETRLAETPVSVSSIAVRLCEKIFESLHGRRALVVGAGEIASLAAEHLLERGARITIFSTRRREPAEDLARTLSVDCRPVEDLPACLTDADIVINGSGAPHILLTAEHLRDAHRRRKGRPLFLVDLGVPRNIAPEASELENVFLYNIDDLDAIANEHRREREREIPLCEGMIRSEAQAYRESRSGAAQEETLRRFHSRIADVVEQELLRSGVDGTALEALKKSIPNRILSEAFRKSRAGIADPDRRTLLAALRNFFGL